MDFFAVNGNEPAGALFADRSKLSGKVVADVYIDDKNLGGLPDWDKIYEIITHTKPETPRRHHRPWYKRIFRRKKRK